MTTPKVTASRQGLRFRRWMLTPKTFAGGLGRLFVGVTVLSLPALMLQSLTSCASEQSVEQPKVEQVQASPSPVASPSPSPSPIAATTYDVTLQVNTEDGDRLAEPGKLEIEGDIYKVSVPRGGLNAAGESAQHTMVYEFNFAAKTSRQYCEDCIQPLPRDVAKDKPLIVDSVTTDSFTATPQGMADELGTKDFYVLQLTGSVKPDVWLESSVQYQAVEQPTEPPPQEVKEPDPEPVAESAPAAPQVRTSGNCSSFASHAKAQASLEAGNSKLDRDRDGVACESLL